MAGYYSPDQITGKKVIVVANLKPVKLMGVESQGMILASSFEDSLELASFKDTPNGTVVS